MRLLINFGQNYKKEVVWWDDVLKFPSLIKLLGKNYEWFFYDKDPTGKVDQILNFAELPSYDPNYAISCPLWEDLFPETIYSCQCGAIYTSFPWDHMRFCSKWKPWSQI